MAASSSLTDQELRAELKRFGFSAGPVTNTTRQVYLKKLDKLQAEARLKTVAPKPPTPSRKLLGFSSDESDVESSQSSTRSTAAAGSQRRSMPSQSKSLRRRSTKAKPQAVHNGTTDEHNDVLSKQPSSVNSRLNAGTKSKRYSTGMLPSVRSSLARPDTGNKSRAAGDIYVQRRHHQADRVTVSVTESSAIKKEDEFSDSDVDGNNQNDDEEDMEIDTDMTDNNQTKPNFSTNSRETYRESAHPTNPVMNQTYTKDPKSSNSSVSGRQSSGPWWSTTKASPRQSLSTLTPRTSTPRKSNNRLRLSDAYDDEVDTSKLSATQNNRNALAPVSRNNLKSQQMSIHDHSTPSSNKFRTPGSSFLNSKSNHTPGTHSSTTRPESSQTADKSPSTSFPEEEENLYEEFATEDHSASSLGARIGHYVPRILLSCAFLFFIVLATVYMNVGNGKPGNLADIKYISYDSQNSQKMAAETRHIQAMKIVQSLYDKLSEVAGKYECGSHDVTSRNMSLEEVQAFLKYEFKEDIKGDEVWLSKHLKNALEKIINNSQWGLRLYDEYGKELHEADDVVELEKQTVWLESQNVTMSWLCRVQRSAILVLFRLFLFAVVMLCLLLVYKYIVYRIRREKENKKHVHQLVDGITEILASHHKACCQDKSLSPYLAIPHVRDTLIPLKHRKERQQLWERAVHFINTNESRVRVETQQVAGEEFPVWRWMLPSPVISSFTPMTELELNPNRVKVWQGTAFDNLDTAIKAPRYTPTPCLKIRNMFDPTLESDGDWHVAIEDAVLERCGDNGGIVHVAVDKNSREGCVYVKCATPDNAGHSYRALQGSWFDGKLVTVKYLRLDRYHQRFPFATSCNTPIRPSNNLKKSLSHSHQSPGLEAS